MLKEYKIRKKRDNSRILLDSMENNFFKSKKFLKKLSFKNNIVLNRYYFKSDFKVFKSKLFKYFCVKNNKLEFVLGNGVDELILYICMISKKNIGSISPTFPMYERYTKVLNKKFYNFKLFLKKNKIYINYYKLSKFIKKNKIHTFFLSFPNNPTGNIVNKKEFIKIIKKNNNCCFIIDEAYYDFCKISFIKDINKLKNLVVLRTFSKVGFAALRIGIVFARKKTIQMINKVRCPYNINIFNIFLIPKIINFLNKTNNIKRILKERYIIKKKLSRKNIFFIDSLCNFFLIKISNKIIKDINKNKIKIKLVKTEFKKKKYEEFIRFSIGNRIENKKILNILK
ncbi:aminotransferase class I/II-fold pyridoxal phosphate-dependent enzyme [Candidatus Vidania fulgoroideorum]